MPFVLSLKPVTIRSTTGHTVAVEADKPSFCPEIILADAFAAGCVLCNEKGEILLNSRAFKLVEAPSVAPVAPALVAASAPAGNREAKISASVAALLERGDPKDFAAVSGALKVAAVSEKCGFKVSAEEIRDAMPQNAA